LRPASRPAPLGEALNLAPNTLRRWSAEALTLALPPLKLATTWGLKAAERLGAPAPASRAPAKPAAAPRKRPARHATKKARP
jgi:hypothetical protein